jgi:hypothetical protein
MGERHFAVFSKINLRTNRITCNTHGLRSKNRFSLRSIDRRPLPARCVSTNFSVVTPPQNCIGASRQLRTGSDDDLRPPTKEPRRPSRASWPDRLHRGDRQMSNASRLRKRLEAFASSLRRSGAAWRGDKSPIQATGKQYQSISLIANIFCDWRISDLGSMRGRPTNPSHPPAVPASPRLRRQSRPPPPARWSPSSWPPSSAADRPSRPSDRRSPSPSR